MTVAETMPDFGGKLQSLEHLGAEWGRGRTHIAGKRGNVMLTIDEVASYLKLHPLTVRRLARHGDIPAVKMGRQWRVKRDLLERWVEQRSMSKLDKPG